MKKWIWLVSMDALLIGVLGFLNYGAGNLVSSLVSLAIIAAATGALISVKFEKEWFPPVYYQRIAGNWAIEAKAGVVVAVGFLALLALDSLFYDWFYSGWFGYGIVNGAETVITFVSVLVLLSLLVLQTIWLWNWYRHPDRLSAELQTGISARLVRNSGEAFRNRPVGIQMLILLAVVFFWGAGTALTIAFPPLLVVLVPASLFIGIPVLFILVSRFGYLNVLMNGTAAMSEGKLHEELPVRGKSPLAAHARQLNSLKEGIRLSMSEQAKSERLKTELITNVSHDLRTPLTSIITYTDLLKNQGLAEEERRSYVEILDRKSQRLKVLIEDLFEVSKMASGTVELQRQRVDAIQLMQQALAEHEEEIEASGLEFRVAAPDHPLLIWVDGQKWWRLMDNLIQNALKYSLPGTRVYVSLRESDGQAEFIIKNITRHEIGSDTDELFERFKRGDTSRGTEGSGLGLAIAQSIADLHDGNLKIDVDGDLFKVTVTVPSG
ncbi:sensor histidine kinase [Planococcus lenghuensis]|uniref:histidine kinase n=1 Tax=Planococcus lenghuensis TaxID=2213202 RepID=A0A1Q2L1V3_9BACL|nr:MFS domain-containing histidine kinase [Planococcus lenghuensis]AQQ54393.1 hypothetical protein B0X71_15655 [Planococcus lenghuensis]